MTISKEISIVVSKLSNAGGISDLKEFPLVALGIHLAQKSFRVNFILCNPGLNFSKNIQEYLNQNGIKVHKVSAISSCSVSWLTPQLNLFDLLMSLKSDLVIGESEGGMLALYAGFGLKSAPVLTYLENGIYLDKLKTNSTFSHEGELLRATLEDIQLRKSGAIISNSEISSLIVTSLNNELALEVAPISAGIKDNLTDPGEILSEDIGSIWITTVLRLVNEIEEEQIDSSGASVSVIISTKNRQEFLPNALASCFFQNVPAFEIIVIDDGSDFPELTEKVVKEYSNLLNISLIRNESSLGQSKSRNMGANKAKGKFLAFLDDDNFLLPNHLELCLAQLSNPSVMAACSFMNSVDSVRPINQNSKVDYVMIFAGDHFGSLNHLYNLACDTHIVIRREFFLELGGFPELIQSSAEDWALGLRIINSGGKFQSTGTPTIMYRRNRDGLFATVSGLSKAWPLHTSSQLISIREWWFTEFARFALIHPNSFESKIGYAKVLIRDRAYFSLVRGLLRNVRNVLVSMLKFGLFNRK